VNLSLSVPAGDSVLEWLERHPAEAETLRQFVGLMATELAANDGKGNRPGWLRMNRKEALAEVHWHAAKLAVAAKEATDVPGKGDSLLRRAKHDGAVRDAREFAADVANCSLMVLDCMGLLAVPAPEAAADIAPHIHHGRESM
jgi:hypothetical protein